ncbi:type II toxin-antitoxin system RelE/ParE family toxin [Flavobacterium sp.]|uniref:type II toxin-antitoxin system RelE/ParE family toxin n=1 Tax=Flavobacterium sp. TaxID=239 RepID=UPI0037538788
MENRITYRTVIIYKSYFNDFLGLQNPKVKAKIAWTLKLIEEIQQVPETYLKHIEETDGLYEVRIQQGSDIFRVFSFFDEGKLIVLANGFQKKTQKTPKKEIVKALKIKKEYYENK